MAEAQQNRRYKVGRVVDRYDLPETEVALVERWRDNESSLRELAHDLNREVLRVAMEEAGLQTLDGEVANTYRLLTDDGVSGGMRTQARKRLERGGVDVEAVEDDFVSYQAVRTYLTTVHDVTYAPEADRLEKARESIQRLRTRTATVTEEKLDRLRDADQVDLGEFQLLVNVRVLCEDCGSQYDVADLLERGGCDCGDAG